MSATDELRRMLDERGVEYEQADGWWTSWETEGVYSYGGTVYCEDLGSGLEIRWHTITPGQAIAATLGAGTCHVTVQDNMAETDGMGDVWLECDACRWQMPLEPSTPRFNFCPNCGRKVEG